MKWVPKVFLSKAFVQTRLSASIGARGPPTPNTSPCFFFGGGSCQPYGEEGDIYPGKSGFHGKLPLKRWVLGEGGETSKTVCFGFLKSRHPIDRIVPLIRSNIRMGEMKHMFGWLGPPVVPFYHFLGRVPLLK